MLNVFFQKEELSCDAYAAALVHLLQFKGKFDLCLDRSNWKFGQKNVNYLVLSWRISKELSLPLFFVDLNKAGSSHTKERLDLLEHFQKVFGFDRIKSLMGDREFIGKEWIETLNQHKIPFFIRSKENTRTPYGRDHLPVKAYFEHLKPDEKRLVEKTMYGKTLYFAATRTLKNDLIIVMTNQNLTVSAILNAYKQRWSIEELFRKLKSSGFQWENTHMKKPKRLVTLLVILGLATLIAYLAGTQTKIPFKKTLGCYLRSRFKQGIIHLNHHLGKSLTQTIQWIETLLKQAHLICFPKSDG